MLAAQAIFATEDLGRDCVFKGGTSLSKVVNAIQSFSEDVDLGLSPASLGWTESDLDDAPSNTVRQKRVEQIEAICAAAVGERFRARLESVIFAAIFGTLGFFAGEKSAKHGSDSN